MEVKEWSYEELPEFSEFVEGAEVIETTGDEMGITYLHNVEYALFDQNPLHLQILLPFSRNEQKPKCPCVVFVQGSAWMKQDVYGQLPRVSKLAEKGYVVAIVEYRHSGLASFPAQIIDARNAVRFMRKNAETYNIDADKIIIAGDSSGGHTAMYAGIWNEEEPDILYPEYSAKVSGIINFYGSCSVMKDDSNPIQIYHCLPNSPEGMVMGGVNLNEHPALKERLSVECNISKETEVPDTLIFHGTKDRIVNCEGSVILYRKLKECGKNVKLYLIKGADHGGAEFWTDHVIEIMDQFIKNCVR